MFFLLAFLVILCILFLGGFWKANPIKGKRERKWGWGLSTCSWMFSFGPFSGDGLVPFGWGHLGLEARGFKGKTPWRCLFFFKPSYFR